MERDDIDEVIAREKDHRLDSFRDPNEQMILHLRTYGILSNSEVLAVLGINGWMYPVEKISLNAAGQRRLDESFTVISRMEQFLPEWLDRDSELRRFRDGGSILHRMKQGKAYEVIAAIPIEDDF